MKPAFLVTFNQDTLLKVGFQVLNLFFRHPLVGRRLIETIFFRDIPCASVAMYLWLGSRPVSRVLSWTVIPLGCASPRTSSNLPGNHAGRMIVPLFGLAPGGVFPATSVARRAVRSYRTISPLPAPRGAGGIFSVALSVGSRLPGVTWHPALWSPDFPPGKWVGVNFFTCPPGNGRYHCLK